MPERGIHVPEGITPALRAAGGVAAPPPGSVPVQPVATDGVLINDDIIHQTQQVETLLDIVVIGRYGHIVVQNEGFEAVPIGRGAVFRPGVAPGFDIIDILFVLIVVIGCKIGVVHLFPCIVHAPILAVDVEDAGEARSDVQIQAAFKGKRVDVGITDVGAPVGRRVIVVGCRFQDEPLEFFSGAFREKLVFQLVLIAQLVAGDPVYAALRVGPGIVAVLIEFAVRLGFQFVVFKIFESADRVKYVRDYL